MTAVMIHGIYKLRNNMAIELLSASGLLPLLENFCYACGMNDTLQDTDSVWVSIAIDVFVINSYSIVY